MEMLKVVWQEGMLLRPQHFQQNDRYFEHQLKSRSRLQDIYPWGFFSLEIDRQFLGMAADQPGDLVAGRLPVGPRRCGPVRKGAAGGGITPWAAGRM